MIGFLRGIRRKLANENQFVKYSRYAIGEILLVVIGILIALSINNWNDYNNRESRKKEVLKSVLLELKEVHSYTLQQISLMDERIELFTKIINEWDTFDPNMLSADSLNWYYMAIHTSTLIKYSPRIDYYNSLIASGEIDLIQNSSFIRLNYIYNSLRKDVVTYVNQEVDLHVVIAEVIAKNYSKEFLTANVLNEKFSFAHNETISYLDKVSLINFLNVVKSDGELKSLMIRNLTIIKWKRILLDTRIIPELENLMKSIGPG